MTTKVLFRRVAKTASVFLVLALAILLLQAVEPTPDAYTRFVDEHIRAHGITGVGLYILLAALLSCVSIPRQLLSLVGGYAFGALLGTVFATLGVTLGCILSFFYSRFLCQRIVQRKFGKRIGWLERFLSRSPVAMTFVIRSLPVGSNIATNILAGLTKIPALSFFAGSCLGYIPQNFIFALLGSGVRVDPAWRMVLSAALFIAASIIGIWLYQHYKRDVELLEDPADTAGTAEETPHQ